MTALTAEAARLTAPARPAALRGQKDRKSARFTAACAAGGNRAHRAGRSRKKRCAGAADSQSEKGMATDST